MQTDAEDRTDPALAGLAALAASVCRTPIGVVAVHGPHGPVVIAEHGLSALAGVTNSHAPGLTAFCAHTLDANSTVIVRDALADERFRANPWVAGAPAVRFYAGAALRGPAGEAIGVVAAFDTAPGEPAADQLQGLEALAAVASASVQNLRLLDASGDGVLVVHGATVLFANDSIARMLAEPDPAVLLGADLLARRVEEVPALADGSSYWRLLRADGAELAAEVSQTPITWDGRQAQRFQLRDVTAAVEAYSDLSESEARYRRLADTSTDMITVQAEDGGYRFVSLGCRALTGRAPEDVKRLSQLALIHPEDLAGFLDSHIQARSAGVDRFTISYRLRHRDGGWVPVESIVQLTRDSSGAVVEFQTNTRDITERLLVEQSRELADRRFRVAMDNAPIGMALAGLDGELLEVNRALCDLFDVAESALLGRRLHEFAHPDDAGHAAGQLAQILAGDTESLELETRYRRGSDYVWTLRTVSVVRTPENEPSYLVVQIQDITAWKTIEETLSRQALSDPLTGLANRLMLTQRLTHALLSARRRRTEVGLVFIDLDRFKAVNDTLGHEAGDSMLKQVAQRLARSIREEDTAVRLGGDEFVVLCEDLGGLQDLRLVANRIDAALSDPYRIGDREVAMTASIGLSVARDDNADSLLRHSDAAMYEAKRRGRGRTEVYDGDQALPRSA